MLSFTSAFVPDRDITAENVVVTVCCPDTNSAPATHRTGELGDLILSESNARHHMGCILVTVKGEQSAMCHMMMMMRLKITLYGDANDP